MKQLTNQASGLFRKMLIFPYSPPRDVVPYFPKRRASPLYTPTKKETSYRHFLRLSGRRLLKASITSIQKHPPDRPIQKRKSSQAMHLIREQFKAFTLLFLMSPLGFFASPLSSRSDGHHTPLRKNKSRTLCPNRAPSTPLAPGTTCTGPGRICLFSPAGPFAMTSSARQKPRIRAKNGVWHDAC